MSSEETKEKILDFFENIEKYYNCNTEITEGLYSQNESFEAAFTTWNLSEFVLIRSAYRNIGNRFMFEGEKMYYEIAAKNIISLEQPGRNRFEFIEKYSDNVYRITKIRFHYNY